MKKPCRPLPPIIINTIFLPSVGVSKITVGPWWQCNDFRTVIVVHMIFTRSFDVDTDYVRGNTMNDEDDGAKYGQRRRRRRTTVRGGDVLAVACLSARTAQRNPRRSVSAPPPAGTIQQHYTVRSAGCSFHHPSHPTNKAVSDAEKSYGQRRDKNSL